MNPIPTKPLLELKNISLSYGKHNVIRQIDLSLQEGEIGCLLGSSGCGKTTLLRSIAGFEKPDQGQILIRDHIVSDPIHNVSPEQRQIGMVFQDFALFPHMSVFKNIAFGLKAGHLNYSAHDQKKRVQELLDMIGLSGIGDKFPHQLSGGQQQRVALARALAPKPDLLLLDEPFSSLDVELREQLATEVARIIRHEGLTAILVTHDQHEAFAMADKVGLLHQGTMVQWATPYNLYHRPATPYVADFIGQGVFITGLVMDQNSIATDLGTIEGKVPDGCRNGCRVSVLVRPDDVLHDDDSIHMLEVTDRVFRGSEFLYTLKVNDQYNILCIAPSHHDHALHSKIGIRLDMDHLVVFKHNDVSEA
jgi:iron(III) transport system ATP-binding protein